MSTHTIADIQDADELWDEMPLSDLSVALDIPFGTLSRWAHKGWISTNVDHQAGVKDYPKSTVDLADALWDVYPLGKVADLLDVPEGTLRTWAYKGWIETDTNHDRDPEMADKVRRAAKLVYIEGKTQREAAAILDVAEATISRRLKRYREGDY